MHGQNSFFQPFTLGTQQRLKEAQISPALSTHAATDVGAEAAGAPAPSHGGVAAASYGGGPSAGVDASGGKGS